MVRISLGGLSLGVINLKDYGYTIPQLEACGYKIEVLN